MSLGLQCDQCRESAEYYGAPATAKRLAEFDGWALNVPEIDAALSLCPSCVKRRVSESDDEELMLSFEFDELDLDEDGNERWAEDRWSDIEGLHQLQQSDYQ